MNPRIFCCVLSGGISWSDRAVERHGDYKPLAFLEFRSLALRTELDCPAAFRAEIEHDAAWFQARRGEQYQTTTSGQTVTLGHA